MSEKPIEAPVATGLRGIDLRWVGMIALAVANDIITIVRAEFELE